MEELANLEEERGNPSYGGNGGKEWIASNEMCTRRIRLPEKGTY